MLRIPIARAPPSKLFGLMTKETENSPVYKPGKSKDSQTEKDEDVTEIGEERFDQD